MLRTENRIPQSLEVKVRLEAVVMTKDVSGNGLCLVMTNPLGVNIELAFDINLGSDSASIQCKGKVVRCELSRTQPDTYDVGVCFTEISDEDRARITQFVEKNVRCVKR